MNNTIIIGIAIVTALAFASCKKIQGGGPVMTEMRTSKGFTSIGADIDGDVYVTPDSVFRVEIRAQRNILDIIRTPVVNGELRLEYKHDVVIGRHDRVSVYVHAPVPEGFSVSRPGRVVEHVVSCNDGHIEISGKGNIYIPAILR